MPAVSRDAWLPLVPYGGEFLFVDEVLDYNECGIETSKFFSASNAALKAHFANGPKIIPGVLLIEQVCQSALIWGALMRPDVAGRPFYLGQVRATFHLPLQADSLTHASITIVELRTAFGIDGKVYGADRDRVACRVLGTVIRIE
jgi:3-hydroxymyristoyl/3-hydroxydecanoyl-(acyl carrier protein) dehydratase